jgi:hypothetical protein
MRGDFALLWIVGWFGYIAVSSLHYYFIMRTLRQIQKKLNGEDE